MGETNQQKSVDAASKLSSDVNVQQINKAADIQSYDLTGSSGYTSAKSLLDASYNKAAAGYASSLASYSEQATKDAVGQGISNVYGTENTYGAMGGGNSGAAAAAAARGMADPLAKANTSIAELGMRQQESLAGMDTANTRQLAGEFTGVQTPTYATGPSAQESAMTAAVAKNDQGT